MKPVPVPVPVPIPVQVPRARWLGAVGLSQLLGAAPLAHAQADAEDASSTSIDEPDASGAKLTPDEAARVLAQALPDAPDARRARCPPRRLAAPVPRRAAARRPAAPDRPRAPTGRCRPRPRRGRRVDRRLPERRVPLGQPGQGARSVRTLPGRQEPLDRRACGAQAQGSSGAASRSESLRQAQLAMLDGRLGAGRWNHPFYWAPYALFGDPLR